MARSHSAVKVLVVGNCCSRAKCWDIRYTGGVGAGSTGRNPVGEEGQCLVVEDPLEASCYS